MKPTENATYINCTDISEFIMLGFESLHDLQFLLFLVLLVIYIITISGNLTIFLLVVSSSQLHTPMYFFLGNFSCMETFYSSVILPRMLTSLITGDRTISVKDCLVQLYFFGFLVCTECYLLAVMSYDRYLAICQPLHYGTLMNEKFCLKLAAGSWLCALLPISIIIIVMSSLHFCGSAGIDHFFCDFPAFIKLASGDTQLVQVLAFIFSAIDTLPPFVLTLTSYFHIIATILRIPSITGRKKAFSTCSSHLTVVIIFYGTLMAVYILPKSETWGDMNKIFSLFYTVLTPMVNPLVYCLRNKEVKQCLRRWIRNLLGFQKL
ncbi:LOW QUALITY PROTEIN: olfactory receptor 6N1-like [Heteronotia binoei]|uniref:LOW QUALITY PROTEIN: olfactory receptor 6N1-like n=1 Tax=Heteronotia binoei TaxID=13085 RepID=UPI00292CB43B|nr:LOW QUALITY PROTEIN: olfactory receptor 6N1-like [Heteronotia binoei]